MKQEVPHTSMLMHSTQVSGLAVAVLTVLLAPPEGGPQGAEPLQGAPVTARLFMGRVAFCKQSNRTPGSITGG